MSVQLLQFVFGVCSPEPCEPETIFVAFNTFFGSMHPVCYSLDCMTFILAAAAFFCTYELTKRFLGPQLPDAFAPVVHMAAATVGEVVSHVILQLCNGTSLQ